MMGGHRDRSPGRWGGSSSPSRRFERRDSGRRTGRHRSSSAHRKRQRRDTNTSSSYDRRIRSRHEQLERSFSAQIGQKHGKSKDFPHRRAYYRPSSSERNCRRRRRRSSSDENDRTSVSNDRWEASNGPLKGEDEDGLIYESDQDVYKSIIRSHRSETTGGNRADQRQKGRMCKESDPKKLDKPEQSKHDKAGSEERANDLAANNHAHKPAQISRRGKFGAKPGQQDPCEGTCSEKEKKLREVVLRSFLLKQRQQQDKLAMNSDEDLDGTPASSSRDKARDWVQSTNQLAAKDLFSRENDGGTTKSPMHDEDTASSSDSDESVVFRVFEDENTTPSSKDQQVSSGDGGAPQQQGGKKGGGASKGAVVLGALEGGGEGGRGSAAPAAAAGGSGDQGDDGRSLSDGAHSTSSDEGIIFRVMEENGPDGEDQTQQKVPPKKEERNAPNQPPDEAKADVFPSTKKEPQAKVFDMFADDVDELPKPHELGAGGAAAAAAAGAPGGGGAGAGGGGGGAGDDDAPGLAGDWDDAEGYYAFRAGEALGPGGRYKVVHALGRGVFSSVLKALDAREGDRPVALKVIRANDLMATAGQKELSILKQLAKTDPEGKRHCVRAWDSFEFRGHLVLALEALHLNFRKLVRQHGGGQGISLRAVRSFSKQLMIALKHIHKNEFVHADLKPDNMIVNSDLNILKVCDFGSAYRLHETEELNRTQYVCSRFYRAPEICLGYPPKGPPMDVWSAACSLFEMYTGKVLITGRTNNHIVRNIIDLRGPIPRKLIKQAHFRDLYYDGNFSYMYQHISKKKNEDGENIVTVKTIPNLTATKDLWDLLLPPKAAKKANQALRTQLGLFQNFLEKCLDVDPSKRLTAAQALKHAFIKREVHGAEC